MLQSYGVNINLTKDKRSRLPKACLNYIYCLCLRQQSNKHDECVCAAQQTINLNTKTGGDIGPASSAIKLIKCFDLSIINKEICKHINILSSKGIEPFTAINQFFYRESPLPIGSPALRYFKSTWT